MPSPFPGMDPYLENPKLWPNVHHGLISECQAELNRQLLPKYVASIEESVYITDEDDPASEYVVPDVHVVAYRQNARLRPLESTGVLLIEPIEISTPAYDEVHEARIEISDPSDQAVITVIEFLSPTNKLSGSYGRKSYLQKRSKVIQSSSHLVEIDLLRAGLRMHIREALPPHEYLVHLSRFSEEHWRQGKVWPIPLRLRLPIIPIPLKPPDPDALIDLQLILRNAIARGGYDAKINYAADPVPPLTPEQSAWAKSLIAAGNQT